jgi:hypothetical protein
MKLLVIFLITLAVGQMISVGVGLMIERQTTPYAGLVTFIGMYFATFWLSWRLAVRLTAPGPRSASELHADR